MREPLLLAALGVWTIGAAIDLVFGADRTARRVAPYLAGLLGAGSVCASGVIAVLGPARTVDLGTTLGVGETTLRLDSLAGLFLTLTGGLGVLVSACLLGWTRPAGRIHGRGTGAGYLLLLGSVVVVIVAGDAFTFLFAWESVTVAIYILTGVRRASLPDSRGAWLTFAIGKIGGAAVMIGLLLLAGQAGTYEFSGWTRLPPDGVHVAAYALLVAGFGAKVGIVPLQPWIPVGYPLSPGPTRAAMAGIAANIGFYGLWRFLGVLGRPPVALVVVVLVAGGVTALLGIAFAAVETRLSRAIAYSSIENAGVILVGYGVALAGATAGQPRLVAIGLLAASLQVLAHAVAKSALFASASFVISDCGTDHLDALTGIGRTHPWSSVSFGLGSLTLAGLPPTIGFVSAWFILEALLQQFRVSGLPLRLAMAVAGAMVALTAGVAALTFVRLLGLTILGRSDQRSLRSTTKWTAGAAKGGLAVLAALCLALAAATPWVIRFVGLGLAPIVSPAIVTASLKSAWVVQPVYSNFSILAPSWLFVTMSIGFVAVSVTAISLSRGRMLRVRRVPAWRSASAGVDGIDHYTSFGYANPARHVLGNILGTRTEAVLVEGGDGENGDASHLEVRSHVVEPVETYLYRPAAHLLFRVAELAKRLQSGHLEAYVSYMLVALLVVLSIVAALH
jgi:hydrogenase-4 component B